MRKRLGQHFLKNRQKIKQIVEALGISKGDGAVIEIGGGHGELTEFLNDESRRMNNALIVIEKDKILAEKLKEKFPDAEVIEGDALKVLPGIIHNSLFSIHNYKLCGNIPYYITGKLLRAISELEEKPRETVLTVQREVAERMCAVPPHMNLLAASVRFWGIPKIVGYIGKEDFSPPPEVDSAIIKISPRSPVSGAPDPKPEVYYQFIKIFFKQPRKTVLNNLSAAVPRERALTVLKKLSISLNARPQDVEFRELLALSKLV